jgi:hypothetical protein
LKFQLESQASENHLKSPITITFLAAFFEK